MAAAHMTPADAVFAEADLLADAAIGKDGNHDVSHAQKVHIKCQQRTARKCITSIQGLHPDLDFKRLLKAFKKNFSCNGAIVEDKECGTVLQLQGDQRASASGFLVREGIVQREDLQTHGF